jgi:hypothetical protein
MSIWVTLREAILEIASPGKACPERSEWERRVRNDMQI